MLKKKWLILISVILVLSACNHQPKVKEDKIILDQEQIFKDSFVYKDVEVYAITYLSDGLKVKGFIARPKELNGKAPVMIYNRGGNREYGKIDDNKLSKWVIPWARRGYIVLASQYRGNAGGEGKEAFGGSDIHDVLNLKKVAEELPYADAENLVMLGVSRGGMMTYLAIKEQMDIKAAAVIGGVTDLFANYEYRGTGMKQVLETLVGSPETDKDEYIKRSAVYWADKIDVPILILHGEEDDRVSIQEPEALAEKLNEHDKEYKYISYPNGNHGLDTHRMLADKEIKIWFENNLNY